MSQSALATSLPDLSLAPRDIYPTLAQYFFSSKVPYEPLTQLIEPYLPDLLALLKEQTQLDFFGYKEQTLLRRIEKNMRLYDESDLQAYLLTLREQPERLNELVQDFLIGVTDFFRDAAAFEYLREHFVPRFLQRAEPGQELRIWVCGCSTGQEAYSLAMCLHAHFEAKQLFHPFRLIASDVSEVALTRASQARYLPAEVQSLPERFRMRYLIYDGTHYQVLPEIRDMLIFTRNDVLVDPPFINLDLLVCRNLLIYLQSSHQQQVLSNFHYALAEGGYLWLGPSESLGTLSGSFSVVDDRHKFFRALSTTPKLLPKFVRKLTHPSPPTRFAPPQSGSRMVVRGRREESSYASLRAELRLAHGLLERFAPDALLINGNYEVLYQTGQVKRYLSLPRLRMSQNLFAMVPQRLAVRLSEALARLRQRNQPVLLSQINVAPEGEPSVLCDLWLQRLDLTSQGRGETEYFLVEFRHEPAETSLGPTSPIVVGHQDHNEELYQTIYQLQEEVYDTQAELQSTIEHLEASHEELQSTNEELLAANEELQSTNEELHSVNEELHSVNAEVQESNHQLRQANNDLDNLIDSTDAALLFLDKNLHIRRFSEQVQVIFPIEARDEGRFLGDLVHHLPGVDLVGPGRKVLAEGAPMVLTVEHKDGSDIRVGIRPYRSAGSQASTGIVMTFINITEQIRSLRQELSRSEERFRALVDKAKDYITIIDPAGRIQYCNWHSEQMPMDRLMGRPLVDLVHAPDQAVMLTALQQVVDQGGSSGFTTHTPTPEGGAMWHDNQLTPIFDEAGQVERVLVIGRDITERVLLERKLEDQQRQFTTFMQSSPIIAWIKDVNFRYTYLNPAFCQAIHASPEVWLGRTDYELQAPTIASQLRRNDEEVLRKRDTIITIENVPQPDGNFSYSQTVKFPIFEGDRVTHIGGFALDITDLKQREESVERMRRELEQIVTNRTEELETLNRELRTFNHTVAHDLRSPIRAVYSFARLIEEDFGDQLPDGAKAYLAKILDRSQKMGKLVDDLLTFSRLGTLSVEIKPLDLDAMVRQIVHNFEEEQRYPRTKVLVESLPRALGDASLMEQVLNNVLGNAFKYSSREPKPIVEVSYREEEGEELVVMIEDNGVGFDSQYATEIFEIFERLRKESEFPGTGVGLAIVQKVMTMQGGRVWAEGQLGKGAKFFLALPISSTPPTSQI